MWIYILCGILVIFNEIICDPLQKSFSHPYSHANMSAVHKLQEYLQIDTSRQENLELSTEFWRREARSLDLDFKVYRPAGLPICVLTWRGSSPELPSIMLNSHADVVPVYESQWTYPPFSGHIDEHGDIYGRGSQDTKSIGIQYLEAIRRLKESGVTPKRTIHVTVMPDEEVGSDRGIRPFLKTSDFKSLNVGFVLDEGATSSDATLYASYVDKRPWQMEITIRENSGHPSSLPETDIIKKLQKLLDMTLSFRSEQLLIKNSTSPIDFGAYSTLNINSIQGGIANNVIPSEMRVVVDIRLSASTSVTDFQEMINSWVRTLGNGTEVRFIRKADESAATAVDDSNPYWVAMKEVANDLNITLLPIVCPATTDMLYVRDLGIPAFGFAPRQHMKNLLHDHNEYIPVDMFLRGIEIYVAMIMRLGDFNRLDNTLYIPVLSVQLGHNTCAPGIISTLLALVVLTALK